MKNTSLIIGGIIVIILLVVFGVALLLLLRPFPTHVVPPTSQVNASDVKNASYVVDGEPIALVNGKAERAAALGSAATEVFALFGEPTYGDLDGDGDKDAIMYLTRDAGGSGTFYYVVVAVNDNGTYTGTNAMFLGDRIAPQNINMDGGNAVANFAERKAGEPFSVSPSVGKSVWVHLDPKTNEIGELVKNFEGEADPSRMSLGMKQWTWLRTEYTDGNTVTPRKTEAFTLTLKGDASFSATTDCNSMGGKYAVKGSVLTFGNMMSTLMFCEGSQESEFSTMLGGVSGYHFTSKGELFLEFGGGKGNVEFR